MINGDTVTTKALGITYRNNHKGTAISMYISSWLLHTVRADLRRYGWVRQASSSTNTTMYVGLDATGTAGQDEMRKPEPHP